MKDTNKTTIHSYNEHVQEYIDGTERYVSGATKGWINRALAGMPYNAKILEIGTASGRDAAYIETEGYVVDRTDAALGFVKWLREKSYDANMLNVVTDEIPTGYDLIFADAVLLHFTRDETKSVISKVYDALSDEGRFALSLIIGKGDRWTKGKLGSPRYFCYWQAEEVKALLRIAGFDDIEITETEEAYITAKWMFVIASKQR